MIIEDLRIKNYNKNISYDIGYIRTPYKIKDILFIRDYSDYLFNEEWSKQCNKAHKNLLSLIGGSNVF